MATRQSITPEIVRQLIRYDAETGVLTWLHRDVRWFKCQRDANRWNGRWAGKPALTQVDKDGYRCGTLLGCSTFFAHRAAWMIANGVMPIFIDHENGVRDDNRLANLRSVTIQQNGQNASRYRNNTSGVTGVGWHKRAGKWKSEIVVSGRTVHLGLFVDIADAAAARRTAESRYGFHPNHGRHG